MTSEEKEKVADHLKRRRHRVNGFEEWGGYMASKKMKLAAQFSGQRHIESEDQAVQTDIFKGVSIFVNGYTKPSAEELKRLMLIHGGTYNYYYSTTKTTHIIASNLPYSKIKTLKNEIVVKPEWITHSIEAGRLLSHHDYLLYTPEFTHKQQRLKFENYQDSKTLAGGSNNYLNSSENSSPSVSVHNVSEKQDMLSEECNEPETSPSKKDFHKIVDDKHSLSSDKKEKSVTVVSPLKNEVPITAGQPGFLSEFYSHSRLHHISTAGQDLKRYVQSLVDNRSSNTFAGRENLKRLIKNGNIPAFQRDIDYAMENPTNSRSNHIIMHLDMDCFFVSVGLKKYPELKGEPVAVTHSKGKKGGPQDGSDIHYEASYYMNWSKKKLDGLMTMEGNSQAELEYDNSEQNSTVVKYSKEYGSLSEIASCSYEARKAGIRNGMMLGEALRRCPNLKTMPYDFEGYSEVSKQLYDVVTSYTLYIEAVSCDELYIDCTEIMQDVDISPLQFASILRAEIEEKTGCTASAGIGSNMLLARLATKVAKPNGQYFITKEKVQEFIVKQRVKDLPGVGYATSSKFKNMGVITCGDLQNWSLSKLQQEFGPKTGQTLFHRCRGKDDRILQLQKDRKSVSAEINYGIRFEQEEDIYKFLKELSVEVVNRLRNINSKGKSITLKLMVRHPDAPLQTAKFMGHGVCDHISKSVLLKTATDDPNVIANECCALARRLKVKPDDYRGVGIQLSKLESTQKDTKGYKNIEHFLNTNSLNNEHCISNKEVFSPKLPEHINKSKGCSIKDLLTIKPSPSKQPLYEPQALSVDELDQSVLNALPEDLQKEVLEMYGNKSSSRPPDSNEHSDQFVLPSLSASSKFSKVSLKKETHLHHSKNKKKDKQSTLHDNILCAKMQSETIAVRKKATIGGAENIDDVRTLIKEWILSSQVVLDEDVDQFRDYILQVIDEDLKKVDLILKYFYRIVSTANNLWQQAYLTILSYVQQKMLQKYGTMLEAKSDF